MYNELEILVESILILIGVIIAHELGHYIVARLLGYSPVFIWYRGNPAVRHESCKTRKESSYIGMSGILFGYIMIIFLYLLNFLEEDITVWLAIIIGYSLGCINDAWGIILNIITSNRSDLK